MTDQSITETRELPHEGTVRSFRKDIARWAMHAEKAYETIADNASATEDDNPFADPNYVPLQMGAQAGWALASLLKWIENKVGAEQAYSAACLVQLLYMDGGTEHLCDDIAVDLGIEPDPDCSIPVAVVPPIPADLVAKAGERA